MTDLLTAAQMRAIEQAAIASGEVTGLELMERAGQGVLDAVFDHWPDLAAGPSRAVVLCGPGNNGGDGFVVARLLRHWGWQVEVFLFGDAEKLPVDAKTNYQRWSELGATGKLCADTIAETLKHSALPDLLVDAVFGTGLMRPVEGDLAAALAGVDGLRQTAGLRVVAVDIPSGLCSDSGRSLGAFATADLTVSFHTAKVGHFLSRAPEHCGRVLVKPIGLAAKWNQQAVGPLVRQAGRPAGPMLSKGSTSHKYSHGHALVLSGGPGKGGAARLAARGALRVGAGLVTLGCPAAALPENAAQLNAVMLTPLGSDADLSRLLEADARITGLCLGPGLGTDAQESQMLAVVLAATAPPAGAGGTGSGPGRRGVVLDADALTLIAADPALFGALHQECVLTPHAGEFARLFPDIAEKLAATPSSGPAFSKVDATREAACRAGCTVVFKGADTVIASPDGRCAINSAHYDRAAPWLATAGSGDVLAGLIAGLLARGFTTQKAAETAAWLHVACALAFGPGLIAEDLPERLPQVFRTLIC